MTSRSRILPRTLGWLAVLARINIPEMLGFGGVNNLQQDVYSEGRL